MHKLLIPLTALSAIYLSGCAHPNDEAPTPPAEENGALRAVGPKGLASQQEDKTGLFTLKKTPSQSSQAPMDETSKEYWVKRVGTVVYNVQHEPVRSLRFQPKVTIYKEVDGWGLIDTQQDEWVKMSDVSLSQPVDVLARPENSTGMPRVNVEEIMKPNNK